MMIWTMRLTGSAPDSIYPYAYFLQPADFHHVPGMYTDVDKMLHTMNTGYYNQAFGTGRYLCCYPIHPAIRTL